MVAREVWRRAMKGVSMWNEAASGRQGNPILESGLVSFSNCFWTLCGDGSRLKSNIFLVFKVLPPGAPTLLRKWAQYGREI